MSTLEFKRLMSTELRMRTTAENLLSAIDKEIASKNALERVQKDLAAAEQREDYEAMADYIVLMRLAAKEYGDAARWANHYRKEIRENVQQDSANEEQAEVRA